MFNVQRPKHDAPSSLALKRSYSGEDVLERLRCIFHDKCYICETKNPFDINVEHRISHNGDEELKYQWSNLFYVCSRCNNIKLSSYDGILDCTNELVDVRNAIRLLPPRSLGKEVCVEQCDDIDGCRETVELLRKVYNSDHTPNKAITASVLRKKIFENYIKLCNFQLELINDDNINIDQTIDQIKNMTTPQYQYSAFNWWIIQEDSDLKKQLGL